MTWLPGTFSVCACGHPWHEGQCRQCECPTGVGPRIHGHATGASLRGPAA